MENIHNEETIESLVNKFNECGSAAAEQLIERCKAVSQAKAKGKNGFEEFCEKVKCKPSLSTTRKYLKIGLEADWLLPITNHLPAEWTTIYDVAVLGQTKAKDLISCGKLHPHATAKELKAATTASDDVAADTNAADETIGTAEKCVFQIDASDLTDQDRSNLYLDLEEAAARHGLSVTGLPERLTETLIIDREAA